MGATRVGGNGEAVGVISAGADCAEGSVTGAVGALDRGKGDTAFTGTG